MTNPRSSLIGILIGYLAVATITLLFILSITFIFIASPFQMFGQSMMPNLKTNQRFMANKMHYRFSQPQRGDIIVFHAPKATNCPKENECKFIKRIVGLPSETVSFRNNNIYVNNEILAEPYLSKELADQPSDNTQDKPITLKQDEYFVAGDNRPFSNDSRFWGPIQKSDIVGKLWFKYF